MQRRSEVVPHAVSGARAGEASALLAAKFVSFATIMYVRSITKTRIVL